jgi:CBS domain containing-hemolysin-like protein
MSVALIIAFVVLSFLAASFSALEAALTLLREMRQSASTSVKNEALRNPVPYLQESLLLGAMVNLLLTALGFYFVTERLPQMGLNPGMGAILIFGLGLVVVEILPKAWAVRAPERAIHWTLPSLLTVRRVASPLMRLLNHVNESLLEKLKPQRLRPRRGITAEEIETLIEMREEQGVIGAEDATVLREILNLNTLSVKDCMTPRVDLPLMPHDSSDAEAAQMLETARSRHVPVFDERADAIIAIIDTDAWRMAGRPAWQTIETTPVFVPETMPALDAMRAHLAKEGSAIVIVDEYGGLEGLLPRRNIVERIFGKVAPSQTTETSIVALTGGRYLVSGAARVDEVERELDISLDAEGLDTMSGLVFNRIGYLPKPGETHEIGPIIVKVQRTARNRIQQLELSLKDKTEAEEES